MRRIEARRRTVGVPRRRRSRILLATWLALLGGLAVPASALAAGGPGLVRSAESALNAAIRDETRALAYETNGDKSSADSALRGAVDEIEFAIQDTEKGLAAGEIPPGVAAEVVLDLREAKREDQTAEDPKNRLSDKQREKHIRLGIAHKRRAGKTLKQIQTTLTGTVVAHEDTPPPPPPLVEDGSDLTGTSEGLLGDIAADVEELNKIEKELLPKNPRGSAAMARATLLDPFLAPARASAVAATSNVTVNGQITSYTVKGYTISSNRPGPGGSGEIRLGIEEPQPSGQLKVLSTSNPPNLLPHTPGTYTFQIGPPATGFAMPVKKGEVLSLDTPGGNYAVNASRAGAELLSSQGRGEEQNPGALWTLTAHPNLELLMRVSIEPSIALTTLEELEKTLKGALNGEHAASARDGSAKRLARHLKAAAAALKKAIGLVATAKGEGAITEQTATSIGFYLRNAATDIRDVTAVRNGPNPRMFAYGSAVETQEALTRVQTAKSLAKKVP